MNVTCLASNVRFFQAKQVRVHEHRNESIFVLQRQVLKIHFTRLNDNKEIIKNFLSYSFL